MHYIAYCTHVVDDRLDLLFEVADINSYVVRQKLVGRGLSQGGINPIHDLQSFVRFCSVSNKCVNLNY